MCVCECTSCTAPFLTHTPPHTEKGIAIFVKQKKRGRATQSGQNESRDRHPDRLQRAARGIHVGTPFSFVFDLMIEELWVSTGGKRQEYITSTVLSFKLSVSLGNLTTVTLVLQDDYLLGSNILFSWTSAWTARNNREAFCHTAAIFFNPHHTTSTIIVVVLFIFWLFLLKLGFDHIFLKQIECMGFRNELKACLLMAIKTFLKVPAWSRG